MPRATTTHTYRVQVVVYIVLVCWSVCTFAKIGFNLFALEKYSNGFELHLLLLDIVYNVG